MMHVFGISFAICFPSGPILATFGSFWVGILVFVLLHLLSVVIDLLRHRLTQSIPSPPESYHFFLLAISMLLVLIHISHFGRRRITCPLLLPFSKSMRRIHEKR